MAYWYFCVETEFVVIIFGKKFGHLPTYPLNATAGVGASCEWKAATLGQSSESGNAPAPGPSRWGVWTVCVSSCNSQTNSNSRYPSQHQGQVLHHIPSWREKISLIWYSWMRQIYFCKLPPPYLAGPKLHYHPLLRMKLYTIAIYIPATHQTISSHKRHPCNTTTKYCTIFCKNKNVSTTKLICSWYKDFSKNKIVSWFSWREQMCEILVSNNIFCDF